MSLRIREDSSQRGLALVQGVQKLVGLQNHLESLKTKHIPAPLQNHVTLGDGTEAVNFLKSFPGNFVAAPEA